ncbi:MAG: hypothetical protein IJO08_00040 [Clostridia bacterium]|nr:hypothetical protein [Clostridia bacterium]
MTNEQMKSYTEILTIINYMEMKYKEKIPKRLIEFFERNKAKEYMFDIDFSKSLKEQNFSKQTLPLLAMINLNYWCETPEEKQALMDIYSENDRKKKEKRIENTAQNAEIEQAEAMTSETNEATCYDMIVLEDEESSWFGRVMYQIKLFFKRKLSK